MADPTWYPQGPTPYTEFTPRYKNALFAPAQGSEDVRAQAASLIPALAPAITRAEGDPTGRAGVRSVQSDPWRGAQTA